ncbi:acyltransferase [Caenimonas koreensis]|uniref:Acyltransferase family protein n=1 Tax=Caenimonas koreensis DSM 17982 TaxID=1121255 RepID=A0A844B7K1_9BURK|nr:acyltransferase [Caenimonas koreensis]MRD49143.1 acyltransferase family protein [Caenimonas koreensis DSM 17982]
MNPVIEGARGLAALMVLLHHYSYHLHGDVAAQLQWIHFFHNGVDLFFVITGFLFAPYLLGTAWMPPAAFTIRRAFRLYPLYLLSLLVSVALVWGKQAGVGEAFFKHLFFIETLPVFPASDAAYFSLVYWTLPVEVAFYAVVALCLRLATQGGAASPGRRLAVMGVVAAISYALSHGWNPDMKSERWIVWQAQLPAMLIEFWFGIALAYALPVLLRERVWQRASLVAGLALGGALFVWYPQAAGEGIGPRPFGYFNVLSALSFALLLGGAMGGDVKADAPLSPGVRLALFGGALSYGMYLFHGMGIAAAEAVAGAWPDALKIALALALTIAASWAAHRLVELPLRAYGRRITARRIPSPPNRVSSQPGPPAA